MLQNQLANYGDKMFDKDTAKIVRRHAFWAAIFLAIPIPVIDITAFVIILWHMYSSLAKRAHKKLDFGSIIVGIIINFLVAFSIDLALTAFVFIGWLGSGFIAYLQFYLSGKMYLETLKQM